MSLGAQSERGFFHSWWVRSSLYADALYFYMGNSAETLVFVKSGGIWNINGNLPRRYVLKETGADSTTGYYFLMGPLKQVVYVFEKLTGNNRRLKWILDRNGNRLTYAYLGSNTSPSSVYEGDGSVGSRKMNIGWDYVSSVITERIWVSGVEQDGRSIAFTYASCPTVYALCSITDARGKVTTFQQQLLSSPYVVTRRTLPRGNTPYTNTIESINLGGSTAPRITAQRDAHSNTMTLSYNPASFDVTETRPDARTAVYRHHGEYGAPESLADVNGNQANFSHTTNQQVASITDRLGDKTSFTYHAASGELATLTNAKGDTVTYTYTAQDQTFDAPPAASVTSGVAAPADSVTFTFYNLTRADYPDGTPEQFTYDAHGNLLTHADRAGQVWTYTYNGRGQVLTETDPRGGGVTYVYNADATLASSKDSDADAATTYAYDAHKRLTRITHPDATFVQIAYDANDNIISFTDENNRTTTYVYDDNNNLVRTTDAVGQVANLSYDLMDRVASSVNRLNQTTNYTYDALGRLAATTDPTSITTSFGYDPRGWLNAITLGGQTWRTTFDAEGIPTQQTTPLDHVTRSQSDALGFTTVVTNPLSAATRFERDALNRITRTTDPLARATDYGYDGRDLLTSVTMPTIGAATYTYNALGNLTRITDLKGSHWDVGYTAMGRLQSLTDPLGQVTNLSYDNRDRLAQMTFPGGGTLVRTYDAASNLTALAYSGGPTLNYTYDALNRLTVANDLALTYDAEGRVTNTQDGIGFGATYDDAGRVKTVTYNNGAFTVTYTYNAATGLLTSVQDGLTSAQVNFTYDNDRRLTGITRPNGVKTTLTWDDAARLTRIHAASGSGTIIDLQYTLDAAGQVTQLNMTASLGPSANLQPQTADFQYDAASQISADGYTYDARGRLTAAPGHTYTWDDASRLTSVDSTTLTYNGAGDLRTRTQSGATTHYYYNYALALTPIVAETAEAVETGRGDAETSPSLPRSLAPLRYYVWTPAGQLLYMIDAADGNKVYHYHFDRTGSTLALTDSSGAVTDAYAYDPYGSLLAHTGASAQPFTFVGAWGVRQEGASGTLYHMRARYYDATTARFVSRDPVWPDIYAPDQINPYQYVGEDPISNTDATGLLPTRDPELRKYLAEARTYRAQEREERKREWAEARERRRNNPEEQNRREERIKNMFGTPPIISPGAKYRLEWRISDDQIMHLPYLENVRAQPASGNWDHNEEVAKAILGPEATPQQIQKLVGELAIYNLAAEQVLREHEMLLRPGTTREDVMKVINKYYKEEWEELVALAACRREYLGTLYVVYNRRVRTTCSHKVAHRHASPTGC
jgi:RHS repeat-associated protein